MKKAFKKPEMIIFDYGHTLVYEASLDLYKGYEKLHSIATTNPFNLTPKQMQAKAQSLIFDNILDAQNKYDIDYYWNFTMRLFFEAYGLNFEEYYTENPIELEILFWNAIAPGNAMPGISKVLELLDKANIKTAVISNISFSEKALKARINSCIPNNKFEFFIASSEYNVRKPNRLLFQSALQKADLPANSVWYCGDNIYADIHGADACGIFPLWFNSPLKCAYHRTDESNPNCEHLYITDWNDFSDFVEKHFLD